MNTDILHAISLRHHIEFSLGRSGRGCGAGNGFANSGGHRLGCWCVAHLHFHNVGVARVGTVEVETEFVGIAALELHSWQNQPVVGSL